jgi:ketosteroid isomerase-like protein
VGEAREVMDRITETIFRKDYDAAAALYASDAVAVTPDRGELRGGKEITAWAKELFDAIPDAQWERLTVHEAGDTAIDEGYLTGTNTGPLVAPTGETMPATGKSVRLRSCDIATVENGKITSHHFYFDQMEFAEQLGLTEQTAAAG